MIIRWVTLQMVYTHILQLLHLIILFPLLYTHNLHQMHTWLLYTHFLPFKCKMDTVYMFYLYTLGQDTTGFTFNF